MQTLSLRTLLVLSLPLPIKNLGPHSGQGPPPGTCIFFVENFLIASGEQPLSCHSSSVGLPALGQTF
jgi:hypothetical protein